MGGDGNLASINDVLVGLGTASVDDALQFVDAEQAAARLTAAGFIDVQVDLVPDPARLQPGKQLEAFLGTLVFATVLDPLPHDQRREVVREVAARLPRPEVDYVRLRASAQVPG